MVIEAPWQLPGRAAVHRSLPAPNWLPDRVAIPHASVRREIERQCLVVDQPSGRGGALLVAAEEAIGRCEGLARIVHNVVGVVHLLRAAPGYDVSHSEPQWKDRIFVSLPDRLDGVGALRFAEGVIHESMHLELTFQEAETALVADVQGTMPSPWRDEPRPYQGVMHGLFVFTCLTTFFRAVLHSYGGPEALHVHARLDEIREQVAAIDSKALLSALTPIGSELVADWRGIVLG